MAKSGDQQEHPAATPAKPKIEWRYLYLMGGLIALVVLAHACAPKQVTAMGPAAPETKSERTYDNLSEQKLRLSQANANAAKQAELAREELARGNAANVAPPPYPPPPASSGYYQTQSEPSDRQQRAEEERKRREDALHSLGVVSFRREPLTGGLNQSEAPKRIDEMPMQDLKPVSNEKPEDGKPQYKILVGTFIPCTLENRLNAAYAGPVKCLIANDIYAPDHEHLLVPQGATAIGEVSQANGGTQRLYVAFHRILLDENHSISLDQFRGLNQIGETGLKDQVNHHYMQRFGMSAVIAAIGGLAQIGNYGGGEYSAAGQYRAGITQSLSQSSMQVLESALAVVPTFIEREGNRLLLYIANDLTVPVYVKEEANASR